jgi:hypothetical protein
MNTQIDEIAERIYRFSTFVPEIAAPAGFTFNQYLNRRQRTAAVSLRFAHDVSAGLGGVSHNHAD